jgi:hypothetical protein
VAEPKTRATRASVGAFLAALEDPRQRRDCRKLVALMRKATGAPPKMWGPAIVGFASQPLRYANGKTLDWPLAAFSPRKRNLVVYLMPGFSKEEALLARLGSHKTGKSCLYLKSLDGIDTAALRALVDRSVRKAREPGLGA